MAVDRRGNGGGFLGALVKVLVGAGLAYGMVIAEGFFLESAVSPRAGMKIQVWLDFFMTAQIAAVGATAIASLIWHIVASFSGGNSRGLWLLLLLISTALAVILTAYFLPETQGGVVWAYLFAFLNGSLPYWAATVYTGGPCLYDPIGAIAIRGAAR